MYYQKVSMALAVSLVLALSIWAVQSRGQEQAPPSVERLANQELITTESTLRGSWSMPVQLAVRSVPVYTTKELELLGHRLTNVRVPGQVLEAEKDAAARRQIHEELGALLNSKLVNDKTLEWMEVVLAEPGSYLRPSSRDQLARYFANLSPEILYFGPLKLDRKYKLQIKGQPGEFVSIFIGCETKPDDPWALALRVAPFLGDETYTEANTEDRDFTILRRNDFVRVICGGRSYGTRWVTENGQRKRVVDPKTFFGISIDVDLDKMGTER